MKNATTYKRCNLIKRLDTFDRETAAVLSLFGDRKKPLHLFVRRRKLGKELDRMNGESSTPTSLLGFEIDGGPGGFRRDKEKLPLDVPRREHGGRDVNVRTGQKCQRLAANDSDGDLKQHPFVGLMKRNLRGEDSIKVTFSQHQPRKRVGESKKKKKKASPFTLATSNA